MEVAERPRSFAMDLAIGFFALSARSMDERSARVILKYLLGFCSVMILSFRFGTDPLGPSFGKEFSD